MNVKITKVWSNTDKNGKPYWVAVSSDKTRYPIYNEAVAKKLEKLVPGDVDLDIVESKSGYSYVKDVLGGTPQPVQEEQKPLEVGNIDRLSILRTAVMFTQDKPDMTLEELFQIVGIFENYVKTGVAR